MTRSPMHKLSPARLIAGTWQPADDGSSGAAGRCVIEDRNGRKRAAFAKRGSIDEVVSEALASLLLSGWGLPVPEPFLLEIDGDLAFASADAAYPNLKQRYSLSALDGAARKAAAMVAMRTISGFSTTPKAAACDEAIDNRDRNLGNVLWDGAEEIWIDHAYCFGIGGQEDANKLCAMAIAVGETESVQRGALAAAMMMDRGVPAMALEEASLHLIDASDFVAVALDRISTIGARLLARFPKPNDLLEGVK